MCEYCTQKLSYPIGRLCINAKLTCLTLKLIDVVEVQCVFHLPYVGVSFNSTVYPSDPKCIPNSNPVPSRTPTSNKQRCPTGIPAIISPITHKQIHVQLLTPSSLLFSLVLTPGINPQCHHHSTPAPAPAAPPPSLLS